MSIRPVQWRNARGGKSPEVVLIDQRVLPDKEIYRSYKSVSALARAVEQMVVRGAPAIGVTAAFGVRLAAEKSKAAGVPRLQKQLFAAIERLAATRPTAVNLFWALERMRRVAAREWKDVAALRRAVADEAVRIYEEDLAANKALAAHGARLIRKGARVLTHCNAGALATSGEFGTALGVIKAAHLQGKGITVYADETRPFLQGARLTAWELRKEKIPAFLITDSMAGHLMSREEIDAVVVGADRIAANGDAANKIGTYTLSVLAREHGIPFYIAAPLSTVDLDTPSGKEIPIEERHEREVTHAGGTRVAPKGMAVRNPAFDVTPAKNIAAIITEEGIARAPFKKSLKELKAKGDRASRR